MKALRSKYSHTCQPESESESVARGPGGAGGGGPSGPARRWAGRGTLTLPFQVTGTQTQAASQAAARLTAAGCPGTVARPGPLALADGPGPAG